LKRGQSNFPETKRRRALGNLLQENCSDPFFCEGESVITVYDPRGVVAAEARRISPRVSSVAGLRLGILDNTKWNANKLLRALRGELESAHGLKPAGYYRKESFSRFAAPGLLDEIRKNSDVAVTAIGD
jgi:hypothetical protein